MQSDRVDAARVVELPHARRKRRNLTNAVKRLQCFGAASLQLVAHGDELQLIWPTGNVSTLIPIGKDEYIDRSYREERNRAA
jgi:hypothetical protein